MNFIISENFRKLIKLKLDILTFWPRLSFATLANIIDLDTSYYQFKIDSSSLTYIN